MPCVSRLPRSQSKVTFQARPSGEPEAPELSTMQPSTPARRLCSGCRASPCPRAHQCAPADPSRGARGPVAVGAGEAQGRTPACPLQHTLSPPDSSSFLNGAPCSGAASPLGPFPGREGRDGELSPGRCPACPRAWAASGGPTTAGRPLSSPSRVSSAFSDLSCVPSGPLPLVSGHVAQRCSVSRAPADFAGKGSPPADSRWSHWHLPVPRSLRPLVSCVHRLLLPRRVRPGPWGPQ